MSLHQVANGTERNKMSAPSGVMADMVSGTWIPMRLSNIRHITSNSQYTVTTNK